MAQQSHQNDDVIDGLPEDISKSRIIKLLQSAFGIEAEPKSITAKRIDEGAGYLSIIAIIQSTWPESALRNLRDPTKMPPKSVIVKLPTMAKLRVTFKEMMDDDMIDKMENEMNMLQIVHNNECHIYRTFWHDKQKPPPVLIPRLYGSELLDKDEGLEGALVIEDLSGRAKVPDMIQGLSLAQVLQVVKQLAALHAYCWTHDDWRGKTTTMESKMFDEFIEATRKMVQLIRDKFPAVFTHTSEDILEIIDLDQMIKLLTPTEDHIMGVPVVLVHGDCWANNFMFRVKKKEDSATGESQDEDDIVSDELLALIDWQIAHEGSPTEDLARLLTSSVTPEIRRNHLEIIADVYMTTLTSCMQGTKPPITKEQFLKQYWEYYRAMTPTAIFHITGTATTTYSNLPQETLDQYINRIQQGATDALHYIRNK